MADRIGLEFRWDGPGVREFHEDHRLREVDEIEDVLAAPMAHWAIVTVMLPLDGEKFGFIVDIAGSHKGQLAAITPPGSPRPEGLRRFGSRRR